jgi:hypothetical protein
MAEDVSVVFNNEIETPIIVHSGLPSILTLVVLLGAERWMMEVVQ